MKIPRVKTQGENSQGVKYGVKNTKWPEVSVFTVFWKVLSDHILPRVTNTHARVKNPDEKYRVKNTNWAEVYVFTVFGKVLSDHILPPSGRKFMFSLLFARFCLTTYCQG